MMRLARPYGIMFHHFHDGRHPKGQGSIDADQLDNLIQFIGPERFIPAEEWLERFLSSRLQPTDICITFDDNLRCQYDVALPVLKSYGLTGFWFVYTSVLEGDIENLEIYRHFRNTSFRSIEDFYTSFFFVVRESQWADASERALAAFDPARYLEDFPFYTSNDKKFRYVRDRALGSDAYNDIMDRMIAQHGLSKKALSENLWMNAGQIRALAKDGHVIGLHSHSHPTQLSQLSPAQQRDEFGKNRDILSGLLGKSPRVMSHPCNSYNWSTIECLKEMNIEMGFRANMATSLFGTQFELPREDHTNLLREMDLSCE